MFSYWSFSRTIRDAISMIPGSGERLMRLCLTTVFAVLLLIGLPDSSWGASCQVPSTNHPTIQAAVDDPGCTEIELQAQIFIESVVITRSLSLSGYSAAASIIAGQIGTVGISTVVSMDDLTVDGSHPSVAGCFHETVDVRDGARVLGSNLVVINAGGTACLIFGDGFESGTTGSWSATTP